MLQQNTSSVQDSTGTEKDIHKAILSGTVLWMMRLTAVPSHPMSAHVVTHLPHRGNLDKFEFFPVLEIQHTA